MIPHTHARELSAPQVEAEEKDARLLQDNPRLAALLRPDESARSMLEASRTSGPLVFSRLEALHVVEGGRSRGFSAGEFLEVCGSAKVGKTLLLLDMCAEMLLPDTLEGVPLGE